MKICRKIQLDEFLKAFRYMFQFIYFTYPTNFGLVFERKVEEGEIGTLSSLVALSISTVVVAYLFV